MKTVVTYVFDDNDDDDDGDDDDIDDNDDDDKKTFAAMISIDHVPSADDNEPASAALIPSVQSSPALCAPSPLLANAHTPASSQPQPPEPRSLPHLFAARITLHDGTHTIPSTKPKPRSPKNLQSGKAFLHTTVKNASQGFSPMHSSASGLFFLSKASIPACASTSFLFSWWSKLARGGCLQ